MAKVCSFSCGCDNKRGVEVRVDDKGGERVVLSNLMLLSIDQLGHHFVEVDLLAACTRRLGAHFSDIQLVL